MRKIAMISVNANAANTMVQYFKENEPEVKVINYLDEGLMDLVNREGTVTEHSLNRFISIIAKACEDDMDGILLTCTVFSPHVNKLQSLFSIPIISADGAMLEEAVSLGGRTAILYTFPATRESSSKLFYEYAKLLNIKPNLDLIQLEDAFCAAQRGDIAEHNRIIASKVMELEPNFDVIVLAQISMALAAKQILNPSKIILTSPKSAVESLMKRIYNK